MTRSLIGWTELTRFGTPPEFVVIRQPITASAKTFEAGEIVTHADFAGRNRLRQMYEQRRIEPVQWPPHVQEKLDRRMRTFGGSPVLTGAAVQQEVAAPQVEDSGLPFDPGMQNLPEADLEITEETDGTAGDEITRDSDPATVVAAPNAAASRHKKHGWRK